MTNRWVLATALAVSTLGGAARADMAQPPPQMSTTTVAQLKTFFTAFLDGMVADKDDCAKMANDITDRIDANKALLKQFASDQKAGAKLPPDVEKTINDKMEAVQQSITKCLTDKNVQAAFMRVVDPDQPAPPKVVSYPEVKAPVAEDLATYTKGMKGKGDLIATIKTTEGTIKCQLLPDKAPLAVANFVGLATGKKPWIDPKTQKLMKKKPYYDGTIFHRVIAGFMIQGGDPTGTGMGGPGYEFVNEKSDLKMAAGTMAMANAGPDTNGSQFFITDGAPSYLDGGYTIFGTCANIDIVKKIEAVPKSSGDKPATDVTMKVTIARGKL